MNLGSRNFFLCPRKCDVTEGGGGGGGGGGTVAKTVSSSCSKEAENGRNGWLKFMDFFVPNQSQ